MRRQATISAALIAIALGLILVGCGGESGEDTTEATEDTSDAADAATDAFEDADDADEPSTIDASATPLPSTIPTAVFEPEPFWGDLVTTGDCFDLPTRDGGLPITRPCERVHQAEVFADGTLDLGDGVAFPGRAELALVANERICEAAAERFAGTSSERIPFPTESFVPDEAAWLAGDRSVLCAARPGTNADVKVGSATGETLAIDEPVLVRVALSHPNQGSFEDWVMTSQLDSVDAAPSLTDLAHDLSLARGTITDEGLLFADDGLHFLDWGSGSTRPVDLELAPGDYGAGTAAGTTIVIEFRPQASDDWGLLVIGQNGSTNLIGEPDANERYPALTPDGARVVFQRAGDLWISSTDGSDPERLTETGATEWESAVSPDGEWLAFAADRTGNDEIYLMPITGGEATNLTNHPADESWPVWSADGTRIYFGTDRLSPQIDETHLMVMQADGSATSWFSRFPANHASPLPAEIAAAIQAWAPTLDERVNFELIEGDADSLVTWMHDSGRLSAALPAGWRVIEADVAPGAIAGFFAAAHPNRAETSWDAASVSVALVEAPDAQRFLGQRIRDTRPFTTCVPVATADERVEGTGRTAVEATFDCDGTPVLVLALWQDGLGVLVQAQGTDAPVDEILRTLNWN